MSLFSPALLLHYLLSPNFAWAALTTLCLSLASLLVGMVFGLVLAVGQEAPSRVIRGVVLSYIWLFRGTREQARASLDRVHLPEKADAFPDELSGGQQQRVAIARALAMEPALMLFDEPTRALDPEMVGEVLAVMQELADAGMTSIVVTHELGFARRGADDVVFMDAGCVAYRASSGYFLSRPVPERVERFLSRMMA